ncbi:hypothetical protein SPRG_08614 [Saprolegnia parasitica CBS 223.65]|uniref:Amino acid permease/ SLC12A domain-containing protein n=1 Tax=Saprolegnia parasitica (strain CBS 223.65) TaxID=695850 RepID=A0A067CHC7_SAPPC|nr:hypothetical protein SPRG_08614 [Saprolegnia parasitica CBS 223.65]KDO25961.1 hypothetical protein SPRG_08614 [Saprolegnia parasitica CBS 223.65]|eukprot:XP_012203248.1 hypothetical protein SPRG_08614 [Saprolegnia parasitica CBS 223.65]
MAEYAAMKSPPGCPPDAAAPRKRYLNIAISNDNEQGPSFLYPAKDCGYENVTAPPDEIDAIRVTLNRPKKLLGEWRSTAISGNDLLGSCLYSAGLVAASAGYLAPVGFLLVSLVLYVFRFIYEEVVTAFPLNGGSYNCLLNTTSKRFAAIAACMSILSYLATAVVSATSATFYFQSQFPELPVLGTSIGILGLFGVLNIIGIGESAVVALIIFSFHVLTLTVLVVVSAIYTFKHPDVMKDNFHTALPNVDFAGNIITGNVATALFFGFSSAMLGVTGFETSSNFVENQQPGVFRKTMRNMWGFATVYNPILSLLSLGVLPLHSEDGLMAFQSTVLAQMGYVAGGKWLQLWVAIDALVVLAAGVLTSYVGITGLIRRLSNDRVVPAFLTHENNCRGTPHWISILFFVVSASLVWVLNADATILGGVFTFAFLSMMFLFGAGCITLKLKRTDIPRDVQAPWWACILGVTMVAIGYFCQLLGNPQVLLYFFLYFIVIAGVVFGMVERIAILRLFIFVINVGCGKSKTTKTTATRTPDALESSQPSKVRFFESENHRVAKLTQAIKTMNERPMIFFVKAPNLTTMNKAIMYVRRNEITQHLRFVHVYADENEASAMAIQEMRDMVTLFDSIYPKLRMDFMSVIGNFDPAMIQWIAQEYDVPTNMMFIKQPSNLAAHKVSSRGVRVITG